MLYPLSVLKTNQQTAPSTQVELNRIRVYGTMYHQIHHTKQSDHLASTFTFKQMYLTDNLTDVLYYMEVPRTSWFLSRLHHRGVWHDPVTIGEQIVSK